MSNPSPSHPSKNRLPLILTIVVGIGVAAFLFSRRTPGGGGISPLPLPAADRYAEMVSAFYTGTIALIVQDPDHPEPNLKRATEIVPDEPAAWANLGLIYLRRPTQTQDAQACLEKAQSLAPNSSEIEALLGHLKNKQGKVPEAVAHFRHAVELDGKNLFARYALAELIDRQREPNYENDYQQQMEGILTVQPHNLRALIELARIAAQRKDSKTVEQAMATLSDEAQSWTAPQKQALERAQAEIKSGNLSAVNSRLVIVTNLLVTQPNYRRDINALRPPANTIGVPLEKFLRLPSPSPTAAAADSALTFKEEKITEAGAVSSAPLGVRILAPELTSTVGQNFRLKPRPEAKPSLLLAGKGVLQIVTDSKTLELPLPANASKSLTPDGVAIGDHNYDFRLDIVTASAGGLRLFTQQDDGTFRDSTPVMKLPPAIVNAPLHGVWLADIDLDGDLDIVAGQQDAGTLVLQNNGDGTFTPLKTFEDTKGLRGFAWADVDGDGDGDAIFLDKTGKVFVRSNERSGHFVARPLPSDIGTAAAIAAADVNSDGTMDVVVLQANGAVTRLSDKADGEAWDTSEIARWQNFTAEPAVGSTRLFIADLDNNGGMDLIASSPKSSQIWLGSTKGEFQLLAAPISGGIVSVADMNADGKFDLLAQDASGKPVRLLNQSTKNYGWLELRPRAAYTAPEGGGDNRINSFGIGGEAEIRSGLLTQKQTIADATVHFGLGENPMANFARFVWPNGAVQGEFDLKAGQQITTAQRLLGSCPWLFAWDGKQMQFVTDFIWRSPLGLKINAQATAGVAATEDWVKIRGDQLVPKDGFYDLRITAELWETHFFDGLGLKVVDHPVGTEIWVDERFTMPPPVFKVYATAPPQPIVRATDDNGNDVTETVRTRDGNYLDTFGRGQYQGVTRPHYVEIELPPQAATSGQTYLLANGWIHPTDSSINVAISQGGHAPPQSLQLEVPDGKGGWKVVKPNLGFPSGKTKTILIDLTGIFDGQTASDSNGNLRLRLRTNLEIYWDSLQWAIGKPDTSLKTQRLAPATAELRFRGFSRITQANPSSPELPNYDIIQSQAQVWRDLIGYHTRFGDVKELVQKVEDRYVIMNAGDEMALKFAALTPPASGWVRDYILVGDGWEKDGNYNTTFSKTVLPLPSHSRPDYSTPPGKLEDDPVYRRFPQDWQNYHTRYVTPEAFRSALRSR